MKLPNDAFLRTYSRRQATHIRSTCHSKKVQLPKWLGIQYLGTSGLIIGLYYDY